MRLQMSWFLNNMKILKQARNIYGLKRLCAFCFLSFKADAYCYKKETENIFSCKVNVFKVKTSIL